MRKKLTVYCEPEFIAEAKIRAIKNDMSLSDIVENLLHNLDKVLIKTPEGDQTLFDLYGNKKIKGL